MNFKTVFTSISVNEVNYIKNLLENHEINAFVWDEALSQLAPHYLFWQGGPRVVVPEDQVEKAKEFIESFYSTRESNWDN